MLFDIHFPFRISPLLHMLGLPNGVCVGMCHGASSLSLCIIHALLLFPVNSCLQWGHQCFICGPHAVTACIPLASFLIAFAFSAALL